MGVHEFVVEVRRQPVVVGREDVGERNGSSRILEIDQIGRALDVGDVAGPSDEGLRVEHKVVAKYLHELLSGDGHYCTAGTAAATVSADTAGPSDT